MEQQVSADENAKKLCSTCGSVMVYAETFVEFSCPSCGEEIIKRCKKCKDLSNKYKCTKCGFVGP